MDIAILDSNSLGSEKVRENIPDELALNYQAMDESGKEELLNETEKILGIHKNENAG
jgi:hypothetical protein